MAEGLRGWSLQRRLAQISLSAVVVSLLCCGAAMYFAEIAEDRQATEQRLQEFAQTLETLDGVPAPQVRDRMLVQSRAWEGPAFRYQWWTRDGAWLLGDSPTPPPSPWVPLNRTGFADARIAGEAHRVYTLNLAAHGVIQVAQMLDEESLRVGVLVTYYLGFAVGPLLVVVVASTVFIRRSLRSVQALADELQRRQPMDVEPIRIERPPKELLPIVSATDKLLERAGRAISVERRFTALAAHEMRSPLAGLRAQAQIAQTAPTQTALVESLHAIVQGVDRASHMLDQLLDLAHIEALPGDQALEYTHVSLPKLYGAVMHDLQTKVLQRRVRVSADFAEPTFDAMEFGVYLILRNLITNAVLYSPPGALVQVSTARTERGVVLIVDDSGPGIAPQDRARAFERFNRLGQLHGEGGGLGLSIVLRIVELHGAQIQLEDAPIGGLRARVDFAATGNAFADTAQPGAPTT